MVINANFSISSGEHEILSAPSSQRHSNQANNGLPGHSQHCFPKSCNSAGVYGIYTVNFITVGPPACTHMDPRVVYILPFGILWAVLMGRLLPGCLPLSPRVTLRADFFGAQLLAVHPYIQGICLLLKLLYLCSLC